MASDNFGVLLQLIVDKAQARSDLQRELKELQKEAQLETDVKVSVSDVRKAKKEIENMNKAQQEGTRENIKLRAQQLAHERMALKESKHATDVEIADRQKAMKLATQSSNEELANRRKIAKEQAVATQEEIASREKVRKLNEQTFKEESTARKKAIAEARLQAQEERAFKTSTQGKSDNIISSINSGDYDTRILSYQVQLEKLGLSSTEVEEKMRAVNTAFRDLSDSTKVGNIIPKEVVDRADKLEDEMSKLANTTKQLKLKDSLFSDDIKVDDTITRLNEQLRKNSNYSKNAKAQIKAWIAELERGNVAESRLREINSQARQLHSNMANLNKIGFSPLDKLTQAWEKFGGWSLATGSFTAAINSVRNGIDDIKELDAALVDLRKTTKMTESQLEDFYYTANDVAKQMGVSTVQIIEQASAWSRLGYSSAEAAEKMAKYSSMFKIISPGMELDFATDGLVSVMKAFDIGTRNVDDVVDGIMSKINIIGNTRALDNNDIVEFLTRSSSAMAEANNTLEDTIALGTAAVEITRDAASVGNALKTVSMRIRGYDEETEEYIGGVEQLSGVIADFTKTASTPGGISLFADEAKTEFKSTRQLFEDISKIYGDLTDKQQAGLLEALAGKRQGQIVAAILNNYEAVTDSMNSMANSAGNAEAEMAIAMDSINYKATVLKETGTGIFQNLFEREDMKTVLDWLIAIGESLDFVTDKLGLFGTLGTVGAGIAGAKGLGLTNYVTYHSLRVPFYKVA